MENDEWQREVERALARDHEALTRLVRALTPVVQARVARGLLLWRHGPAAGRDVHQEVEDLTQEIFLLLFADGGRVLRTWQPARGLSLPGFVGLVAERQTASVLRSGKRSPWKEDPTLPDKLDEVGAPGDPEGFAASREELRLLLGRLREELSPLGRQLFDLLFVQELPVEEITARTGMTRDAVYAWRSRLRRLARRLLGEISESVPGGRRIRMDARV